MVPGSMVYWEEYGLWIQTVLKSDPFSAKIKMHVPTSSILLGFSYGLQINVYNVFFLYFLPFIPPLKEIISSTYLHKSI